MISEGWTHPIASKWSKSTSSSKMMMINLCLKLSPGYKESIPHRCLEVGLWKYLTAINYLFSKSFKLQIIFNLEKTQAILLQILAIQKDQWKPLSLTVQTRTSPRVSRSSMLMRRVKRKSKRKKKEAAKITRWNSKHNLMLNRKAEVPNSNKIVLRASKMAVSEVLLLNFPFKK